MIQNSKKVVVVYHGDCPDGFSGAWAAWKKFGRRAEYIPAADRKNPPSGLKNKTVYCIDFTYPLEATRKLIRENRRVVILDHHASMGASIRLAPEHVFDNDHSGAVIAWRYFHPGKPLPPLLRYVEDYDLWRFKLPASAELHTLIDLTALEFRAWNKLAAGFADPSKRRKLADNGRVLLAYQEALVKDIDAGAELVEFGGKKVLAVNSPIFADQLGHLLSARRPPFAVIWRIEHRKLRVSLRANRSFA